MPKSATHEQNKKLKRILVIDDDPVIIKLIETRLAANSFEVLVSSEAPAGLELAIKKSPDLIILDVMMPIINGYNLCRLLKSQKDYRNIPVIMLTSRSEEADKKIGREVGADMYLIKPLKMDELLEAIKKLLKI